MTKILYSYALLALPLSFVGVPLYIYLPDYYSSNFPISLATVGFIILITRILDTITDPLIGYISDKFYYYRKYIICISAVLLGLSFYFLFSPLLADIWLNLALFSILTYLFFSALTINHLALITIFDNKIKATSLRETFTAVGLLCGTIIPSILIAKFATFSAFKVMAIAVLILLCFLAFLFARYCNFETRSDIKQVSLKLVVRSSILRRYILAMFFNGMALATPSTLVVFYVKNFLDLGSYMGLFLFIYFVAAISFIPVWNFVCKRINPLTLFKIGIIGSIITFSACYFVQKGDILFYALICLFSGVFFGIDLIAPTLITNNIIDLQNLGSLRVFVFSVTHFISKISVALVSGFVLIILGKQTGNQYIFSLQIFYTILPCIFKIVALYVIWFLK